MSVHLSLPLSPAGLPICPFQALAESVSARDSVGVYPLWLGARAVCVLCVTVMGLLCLPVTFRSLDWPTVRCSLLPCGFTVTRGPRPMAMPSIFIWSWSRLCLSVLSFVGTGAFGMTVAQGHGLRLLHLLLVSTWVPNAFLPGWTGERQVLGSAESQPFCESGLGAALPPGVIELLFQLGT